MKVDEVDWEITISFIVKGRTEKEAGQAAFKLFKEIPRIKLFSIEGSPLECEEGLGKEEILNYISTQLVEGVPNA